MQVSDDLKSICMTRRVTRIDDASAAGLHAARVLCKALGPSILIMSRGKQFSIPSDRRARLFCSRRAPPDWNVALRAAKIS